MSNPLFFSDFPRGNPLLCFQERGFSIVNSTVMMFLMRNEPTNNSLHPLKNTQKLQKSLWPPESIKTGTRSLCFLFLPFFFFRSAFDRKNPQADSDISKAIQESPLGSRRSLIILYSPRQNTKFGEKPGPASVVRKETSQIALWSPWVPVSLPRHEQSQVSFLISVDQQRQSSARLWPKGSFNIISKT